LNNQINNNKKAQIQTVLQLHLFTWEKTTNPKMHRRQGKHVFCAVWI